MLRRTALCLLALILVWSSVGFGQVRLDHKYLEGDQFKRETVVQFDQTLSIAGMQTESGSERRSLDKCVVDKKDAAGILRMRETIESLEVKITVQGLEYNFNSKMPDNKGTSPLETLRDVHKAMVGHTTTSVIGPDGRIQAIEIDQNLLGGLPVELQQLIKSQIDPAYLKQVANQENERLPSEAVRQGDNWVRTEVVNFGAGQAMSFQTEYTYQGTVTKDGKMLDRITSRTLTVSFALQDSPLPLTLKNSDLKAESQGELLFDRAKGRTVESKSNARITGSLLFAINDKDLPSQLDLKFITSISERP